MRWPWSKPEVREDHSFTDLTVAALVAQANAAVTGDPVGTAALETASGLWARAFAGARVTPETSSTRSITPEVLALIARDMIRRGENIHMVDVAASGAVRLLPVGSWDVRGGWDPDSWIIRCDLFGPSGNITRFVPHSSVTHCRWSVESSRPWWGIGPLAWARSTGALAANLELRLSQEAGAPVGSFVSIPADGGDGGDGDPQGSLKKDIAKARGRQVLVETTSSGWDQGRVAAPQRDWTPVRFGAAPPVVLDALRSNAAMAVLDACGVPGSLALANADGTSQREAWRRFVMGSVEPVLQGIVRHELAEKLDVPSLSFDLSGTWAHDLAGRASAFKAMTVAGMDKALAAVLAGLTQES